jgi:hypothetical protein
MERIEMSQEERDKLEWLKRAKDGVITQREAARKMGVTDRWVRKLLLRMNKCGDAVVVHGLRDRASNRKIASQTQRRAIEVLKQAEWHDFGPTFASEQLAKRHQIRVGKETLRGWMIEAGLWKPGTRRIEEVHCWRPRRSAFGELVQWDTSEHDWLEGRGPVRYLVRLIDDATSWSWGRFVGATRRRSTWPYCGSIWRKTGGWWTSTPTATRCSPWRRGPAKAKPNAPPRTG